MGKRGKGNADSNAVGKGKRRALERPKEHEGGVSGAERERKILFPEIPGE